MNGVLRPALWAALLGLGLFGVFSRVPADDISPMSAQALNTSAVPRVNITQLVSFGDSLSDVGTYAFAHEFGGGLYTTNPGDNSVQIIAAHYGAALRPALTGGFGQPSVSHADGFGFAQGGARVAGPPNPGDETGDTGELQTPLTKQMTAFLSMHGGFTPNQLVLIEGGANDVQDAYVAWAATVETGGLASSGDPAASLQAVVPSLMLAARQLAQLVETAQAHGARRVVVLDVPDIGVTPVAPMLEQQIPGSKQALRQLSLVFNTALDKALPKSSPSSAILRVNTFAMIDEIAADYRKYGFRYDGSKADNMACGPAKLPPAYQADTSSALFCSKATYVSPNADQEYMFADAFHPTARLHKLLADRLITLSDAWLAQQNARQ